MVSDFDNKSVICHVASYQSGCGVNWSLLLFRCSGQVLPAGSLKNSVVVELIHEAYKYVIMVRLLCRSFSATEC